MELGNILFGSNPSMGEYELINRDAWEAVFFQLMDVAGLDIYPTRFENDVFIIRPYWWGDCECDAETVEHEPGCDAILPNFEHRGSGLMLWWYKYPLRDTRINQDISLQQFREIVDECIRSIK